VINLILACEIILLCNVFTDKPTIPTIRGRIYRKYKHTHYNKTLIAIGIDEYKFGSLNQSYSQYKHAFVN